MKLLISIYIGRKTSFYLSCNKGREGERERIYLFRRVPPWPSPTRPHPTFRPHHRKTPRETPARRGGGLGLGVPRVWAALSPLAAAAADFRTDFLFHCCLTKLVSNPWLSLPRAVRPLCARAARDGVASIHPSSSP